MSQMKDTPSTDGPLNKREPLGDAVSPGADDGAWKDRLAEARAQREAVLAEKAQRGEGKKKKQLKPWERAELAAAVRRKQREETGAVTRKALEQKVQTPEPEKAPQVAAALAAVTETPLVLEATVSQGREAEDNPRDRRLWAIAAVFLIGLGAGFVVAAPERIATGFSSLQIMFGNKPEPTGPQDTVASLPAAISNSGNIGILLPESTRPSDLGLSEIVLSQAAFRIGPPEPFSARSGAPQTVTKAFFGERSMLRPLEPVHVVPTPDVNASRLVSAARPRVSLFGQNGIFASQVPAESGSIVRLEERADFVRYTPFQPGTPAAEKAFASEMLRAPTKAYGVEPPLSAADVLGAVQLSSFAASELPLASGVEFGQLPRLGSRTRNTVGALLSPERPDRLDLGSAPIRLAALTEGSRLDFESPFSAAAVVPDVLEAETGFLRAPATLAPAPPTIGVLLTVVPTPKVETWAALPELRDGPVTIEPVQLAALWSDQEIAQLEVSLSIPADVLEFSPPDAVTAPYRAETPPRFAGLDVVLWAPEATPDERVAEVEQSLIEAGFVSDPANRMDIRITQDQVRYFQPSSAEAAAILASSIGARLRDFTSFRPSPPEGTIEVWLQGESVSAPPPTRVARAPRPTTRQTQAQREQQQLLQLRNRLIQTLRQNDF